MSTIRHLALSFALLVVALTAAPAAAAPPGAGPATLFGGYWREFIDHWSGAMKKQNGVVMIAIGVGIVSLIIITRGKWKK